jgi:hypothetical protein
MVYSDTSTKLGLVQDCEMNVFGNYGDISGNANRLYDFTARMNRSLDKVASKIMAVDGRWQWDDSNYTDFPIGQTDLVNGQADYTMSVDFLVIEKVQILDSEDNLVTLQPLDITDPISQQYLDAAATVTDSTPIYYDKKGSSLVLYPTVNYSKTNGLIVHHKRPPSYFAHTDTTKIPGIPSIFHRYVSLDASLDYAISHSMPVKNDLAVLVQTMEVQIEEHYQKRSKDEVRVARPRVNQSR